MDQVSDIIGINITGADGRRLSLPNFTNEVFLDDDPSEDWTKTTAEKDSWAYRERRRSSMRLNIDSYPSIYPSESSPSRSRSRRGSILSLFTHGKDKDGRDVLFSGDGDPEDWHVMSKSEGDAPKMANLRPQEPYLVSQDGILTPWMRGKDNRGRNVILWVQVEEDSKSWAAK